MIACLAPSDLYIDDNVNTLLYAAKAQVISNIPIVNEDPKMKKMRELEIHVKYLTSQLDMANKAIGFFKNVSNNEENTLDFKFEGNTLDSEGMVRRDSRASKLQTGNSKSRIFDSNNDGSEASANFYSNQ